MKTIISFYFSAGADKGSEKMASTTPTKKRQHSPALTAGIALLFIAIVVMVSFAMFTSYDHVSNMISAKTLDIFLTETKWDPREGENVVPNSFIPKNPQIRNNDAADAFVFLKVTVPYDVMTIDDNDSEKGTAVYTDTKLPYYKFVTLNNGTRLYSDEPDNTQMINAGWLLLTGYPLEDTAKRTYTYVYAHVDAANRLLPLMSGHTTANALFDEIYVLNFRERDADPANGVSEFPDYRRDVGIKVEAYGIQTVALKPGNGTTDDPLEVWQILENLM